MRLSPTWTILPRVSERTTAVRVVPMPSMRGSAATMARTASLAAATAAARTDESIRAAALARRRASMKALAATRLA